jgi:hypothetical protein
LTLDSDMKAGLSPIRHPREAGAQKCLDKNRISDAELRFPLSRE